MHLVHVATVTEKDGVRASERARGRKKEQATRREIKEREDIGRGWLEEERDEVGKGGKRPSMRPARARRRQINVRLMLLSTHSAAELRILDSQPVSAQTKRISAEIFPVHPSCAPTPSSAASSSCLRQPSRRSRKLRFRYEDVRASSSLRRLPDSRFFFFLFFSLSLPLSNICSMSPFYLPPHRQKSVLRIIV